MSCLQKNKRKINAAYQCTRPMKITAIQSSLLRDRSLFTGWGGLLFFRKVVGKKYDPPASTWQKKLWPSPAKSEKNCDPPPIPFFYFHLIFFNKNNIFYKKMCSLQQLFCIFWKIWKAVFLHSQAKEADHSLSHSFCMCLMIFFAQFFQVKAPHDQ